MTIQVGKRYVRRDGKITGVITGGANSNYPFIDPAHGRTYDVYGCWDKPLHSSRLDLISEFIEPVEKSDSEKLEDALQKALSEKDSFRTAFTAGWEAAKQVFKKES